MISSNSIELYTDGATRANGTDNSRGGWAWCIVEDGTIMQHGHGAEKRTTNNRMELTAVLEGLRAAYVYKALNNIDIIKVYSDSAYFINCYTQKWYVKWLMNDWYNSQNQPVASKDLWEQIIPFFDREGLEFYKVKGHSGNTYNEYVDKLACGGADKLE